MWGVRNPGKIQRDAFVFRMAELGLMGENKTFNQRTHSRGVPALHSSPPTQLSTLLTRDHIKQTSKSAHYTSHHACTVRFGEGEEKGVGMGVRGCVREVGKTGGVRQSNHTPAA